MLDALRASGGLEPDFLDLFDRAPERAVEVHQALGLRVGAGRPVLVMVDLPSDRKAYRFECRTSDPSWKAQLIDRFAPACFLLVVPPPGLGLNADVTVEATRLEDGRSVPVEFGFETVPGQR
jgi:hypothetical protein